MEVVRMSTESMPMEHTQAERDAAWEKEKREVEIAPLRLDVILKLSLYRQLGWNVTAFLPMILETSRAKRILGEKKIAEVTDALNDTSVSYPHRTINALMALDIFRPFEIAFLTECFFGMNTKANLSDLHTYHEWELAENPDQFETWISRLNLLIGAEISFAPALESVSANGADGLSVYSQKLIEALHTGQGFADTLIADKAVDPWISFILKEGEDSGNFAKALSLIHEGLNKERKLKYAF